MTKHWNIGQSLYHFKKISLKKKMNKNKFPILGMAQIRDKRKPRYIVNEIWNTIIFPISNALITLYTFNLWGMEQIKNSMSM